MDFNRDFAAKTYDIISKMDEGSAAMFVRLVTYDVLMEDIRNNQRSVERASGQILDEIRDEVAKSLKDESPEAKSTAALVSVVSKAWDTNYEELYHRPQPRDKSGRWSVSISHEKTNKKPSKMVRNSKRDLVNDRGFNVTGALSDTRNVGNRFADKWHERANEESTTSGLYHRIEAGSQLLSATGNATGNAKLRLAGDAGQFLGQFGPQAESVIGPHMRRTAYRYRGTERTPDSALIRGANDQARSILRNSGLTDVDTPIRRTAATQAAVNYLKERLPNKRLADLQQKSGKIPPSEGIILDKDGKIVGQAVGYMDDHYLPFNLRNLSQLQGGSYVRSRSSGGLTAEDIYTGLISGARSVTVVSRSGTFTMDFDDEFRGGRRFNDKAAGMVSRYAKTLDAVQSRQVDRAAIPAEDRLRIREEVEEEFEGFRPDEIEDEIKRRIKDYTARPQITPKEMDEINRRATEAAAEGGRAPRGQFTPREWEQIKDDPKKRLLAYRSSMIEDVMAEKEARKFQLDGEGYAAAMDALREQYPYYIQDVRYIHHRDPKAQGLGLSSEADSGYVKPRFNRPEGAKEGYFDPSITGKGKVSADQTNFQNWNVRGGKFTHVPAAATEEAEAETTATDGKIAQRKKVKQEIERGKRQSVINEQLQSIATDLSGISVDQNKYPMLAQSTTDGFDMSTILGDATKRAKFEEEMRNFTNQVRSAGASGRPEDQHWTDLAHRVDAKFKALDAMRVSQGNVEFNHAAYSGEASPKEAYTFKGPEYETGSSAAVYQSGWERVSHQIKLSLGADLKPDVSDEELRKMSTTMGKLFQMTQSAKSGDIGVVYNQLASELPGLSEDQIERWANQMIDTPNRASKRYADLAENLERARRIKAAAGDKLTEEVETKAESVAEKPETIKGTLVKVEEKKEEPEGDSGKADFLKAIHEFAANADNPPEVKEAFRAIHRGVSKGDLDEAMSGLSDLMYHDEKNGRGIRDWMKHLGLIGDEFDDE